MNNMPHRLAAFTLCLVFISAAILAEKPTDIMAKALKQRSKGQYTEAIKNLKSAVENAPNVLQKNLAMSLLGDCQLMAGKNKDAAKTFAELSESADGPEEKAEALYNLIQAHCALGNKKQAEKAFAQIKKKYKKTPYHKLAESFMRAEGLKTDIEAEDAPEQKKEQFKAFGRPSKGTKKSAQAQNEKNDKSKETKTLLKAKDPKQNKAEAKALAKSETKAKAKAEAAAKVGSKATQARAEAEAKAKALAKAGAEAKAGSKAAKAKAAQAKAVSKKGGKKTDAKTAGLLLADLKVKELSEAEKNALVTKILKLQDELKSSPEPEQDDILIELAQNTADFGESLEACKLYDSILRLHPTSRHVEKAYFEAIRLRAVLKVYEAVIGWSKAFLAAFPSSVYKSRIVALVEYAKAKGELDLSSYKPEKKAEPKKKSLDGVEAANKALEADSEYKDGMRKMKDGHYTSALASLKRLTKKHSEAPALWWNCALILVQMEDFKNAEKAIKKMLLIDPENEDGNSLLGYIHYRLENYEEAADAYNQAGQASSGGILFFDAETASERMKKSAETH